ncbi:glycosyltransferase [Ornithinimicrobium sp. Y1694]|uniref:glycosyltransferase n=1 Tax=Ornithinimicrobium sp. Y1694 TaxID=3418590 RepID=UPI003CFA29B1
MSKPDQQDPSTTGTSSGEAASTRRPTSSANTPSAPTPSAHTDSSAHTRPTAHTDDSSPNRSSSQARSSARTRVGEVSAVLLAHPDGRPLDQVLDALAEQTVRPQRVLVAGLDPDGHEAAVLRHHRLVSELRIPLVVRSAGAPGERDREEGHGEDSRERRREEYGQPQQEPQQEPQARQSDAGETLTVEARTLPLAAALDDVRAALPVHEEHWLWLLHDDSLPEPGALAALAAAARRSSRVAVVGPKLVREEDPRLLLGVGHHLTPAGRMADGAGAALVDQGQLDLRQDVLGVPLAGAFVNSQVLADIDGLDRAFAADGVAGLDLGWRAHLAGHRVVVAPDAIVRQGVTGTGIVDPRRTRVRHRQLALARGGLLAGVWRGLGVLITSTLAAILLLLVKRPKEAADEWSDVRAVLSPVSGWGARWRFRGRRSARPGDLRSLFVPASLGWRATMDTVGEALDPRARSRTETRRRTGPAGIQGLETGPVADEFADVGSAPRASRWSWPLAAALVVAVALTGWRWRDLLPSLQPSGTGVVGGELGPAFTDAAGLWRSALDGWRGGGLGHDGGAEPWLLQGSALTRLVELVPGVGGSAAAGVALGWILLLAVPASVLTAHLALRRSSRRPWVRAVLALGWGGLAPLSIGVDEGRVGPVVVHVLAPLLIAGYAVSATPRGGSRRTAAVFATVLGLGLAAQWVPLVLVLSTLGGVLLLILGRGSARWRGATLAILPWALALPWLMRVWSEPLKLLGGAGATVADPAHPAPVEPWELLLLHPGGAPELLTGSWDVLMLWAVIPLWLLAVASMLLSRGRGRRGTVLTSVALVCVGLAVLATRTGIGVLAQPAATHASAAGGATGVENGITLTVTPWSGTLLSFAGAAVLLAAALALDALLDARAARKGEAGFRALTGTVVALTGIATTAILGWGTILAGQGSVSLERAEDPLPAVAREQGGGPSAVRTLVLHPRSETGEIGEETPYRLVVDLVGDEPEPARILRDGAALAYGVGADPTPVSQSVAAVTGEVTPQEAVAELGALGVGYVHLLADETNPLVAQLDRLPGATRVSSPPEEVLWRIAGEPTGRLRAVDADGGVGQVIPVTGPHAATSELLELDDDTTLTVAEGSGWAEQAELRVDGEPVEIRPDGTAALSAGTHDLELRLRTPGLPWQLITLVIAGLVGFLALPVGRTEDEERER